VFFGWSDAARHGWIFFHIAHDVINRDLKFAVPIASQPRNDDDEQPTRHTTSTTTAKGDNTKDGSQRTPQREQSHAPSKKQKKDGNKPHRSPHVPSARLSFQVPEEEENSPAGSQPQSERTTALS